MTTPSGAFFIHKPAGLTSSDVVTKLKWAMINAGYAEKGFRIGHGGTLDPFATGVLVVLFGEATKLADAYLHSFKSYEGVISLGQQTDTGDLTGAIKSESPIPLLDNQAWQELAHEFRDQPYLQTPPMYSAKKKDGVALHQLARAGIEIEREGIYKKISLFTVSLLSKSEIQFQVDCESGTYVRVIAEDLAIKAGTVAHLKTLIRTGSSHIKLKNCAGLEETLLYLETGAPLESYHAFHPLAELGIHLPAIPVSEETTRSLRNGVKSTTLQLIESIQEQFPDSHYALARCRDVPIALFEKLNENKGFRLQRVFN